MLNASEADITDILASEIMHTLLNVCEIACDGDTIDLSAVGLFGHALLPDDNSVSQARSGPNLA